MFSTREAAALAGAPVRNVDYWARTGVATATVAASGTGSDRLYSYEDVVILAALAELAGETNIPTRRVIAGALRAANVRKAKFLKIRISPIRISPMLVCIVNLARIRERIAPAIAKAGAA